MTGARKASHATVRTHAAPSSGSGGVLLTRRRFLLGAAGVGAAVAVGVGANAVVSSRNTTPTITSLAVSANDVFTLDACAQEERANYFSLDGSYELPFGSLVFCTDDSLACCLLATEKASPLVEVALMSLSTGRYTKVITKAVGAADGFEVYDARATSDGIIWTEADIFSGTWRIYSAPVRSGGIGTETLLDAGDTSSQTPTIAVAGDRCFWCTMPRADASNASSGPLTVKSSAFSAPDPRVILERKGRASSALTSATNGVVIAPRHPDGSRHSQLLYLDGASGAIADELTLPSSMRPSDVAWGTTGFSFCFDGIYNVGDGISKLGTYTPATTTDGYSAGSPWFRFGRTPYGAPAWCGDNWFVVKSSTVVCAIDWARKVYVSLGSVNGATSWGDYLASSGTHSNIVTYATINQRTTDGTTERSCLVRVWRPTNK